MSIDTAGWIIITALLVGITGHIWGVRLVRKITKNLIYNSFTRHCFRPLHWTVVLFAARIATVVYLPSETIQGTGRTENINHILSLLLISSICWLLIKSAYVLEDFIASSFAVNAKDNLKARKIHTQFRVLKRLVIIVISTIGIALILMTFPKIRQLGTTILASAGIIGIVIGMAAQKTIGTFIAGLQIAFTQPIRIDDVVIVEGEWGRIEEITLTYVVVKIWDSRRLIVPITYFIEKSFQNWTRVSADILGTVFLYADYTIPVEEVRNELERILKTSDLWDGKVCVLQVTNATDKTIELRALMSAPDASIAWTLRCLVREQLINFIKTKYPQSLPRFRAEMEPAIKNSGIKLTTN